MLLVRMNADLVMGDELKKTGAGNLFTVFGEPDIEIEHEGDELQRRAPRRRRLRPDHRRGPQQRHRRDRLLVHRHRLQRRDLLRPPLLLHRRPRPLQAAEARAQGRDRRGRLGEALLAPSRRPFPTPGDRQDRGQGHQPLRRRGHEGLRGLTRALAGRACVQMVRTSQRRQRGPGFGAVLASTDAHRRFSDGRLGCSDRRGL